MIELEEGGPVVFVLALELAEEDEEPGLCLGACRLKLGEGVCE